MGRSRWKEKELRRQLRVQPDDARTRLALGNELTKKRRFREAALLYEEGVRLDPDSSIMRMNLGESQLDLDQLEPAIGQFRAILQRQPDHADALASLGGALLRAKQAEEAAKVLTHCVEHLPNDGVVHALLGEALTITEQPQRALIHFARAIELGHHSRSVFFYLAVVACNQHRYALAADAISQGAELSGDEPIPWHVWGKALFEIGDVAAAVGAFRKSYEQGVDESLRELALTIPGDPQSSHEDILSVRRAYAAAISISEPAAAITAEKSSKVRVGYISSFFSSANYMKPVDALLDHHDPERVEVELFHDGPDVSGVRASRHGKAIRQIHELHQKPNEQISQMICDRQLDVLVDLNAFSAMSRLPLLTVRLAKHTIGWFNHFATSGLQAIDFLIGDSQVIRDAERDHYCEEILQLPQSYLSFRVNHPTPAVTPPPRLGNQFLTFGCLCSQYKITPEVLTSWSRILRQAPESRLILANRALESAEMVRHLQQIFEGESIARDRLEFRGGAPHCEFLANYRDIDVALDSWPYNGGTTTTEAIWQGVPVLCFHGDRWASRTSASLIFDSPFREFLCDSLGDLENFAVRLATDPAIGEQLADLRVAARERLLESSVCDVAGLAREMEAIYSRLAERPASCHS